MMKKTKLVLAIATATLTMAGLLVAPQAEAKSKAKKHKHSVTTTTTYSSSSQRYAVPSSNARVEALEAQLQSMQYELQSLRSQVGRPAVDADSAKVQELDQWMNTVKAEPKTKGKNNMVFFRGGYGRMDSNRGGTLDPTAAGGNSGGVLNGVIGNQDAWYFGAGFDWSLNDDLFGMMSGTEVFAELMFDYKELGERAANGITSVVGTKEKLPVPGVNTQTATVNQLTLAASPKIKFFKGQAFRPWVVPVGFELSVISPPSDAITVLNPGMQFGLGADYRVWQNLYVGADARYHYAPDNVDGVNTNGVTAGGYVGIGF
ncbi:MAG: porin family protein [Methylovulum sp.]|nr:porin family protein [Methylovulum sp.]